MDANGDWHRAANGGFEKEYLIGLRFMEMNERFDWNATDIVTVRAFYQWPTFTGLMGLNFGNLGNGKHLLASAAAFRNEPFPW